MDETVEYEWGAVKDDEILETSDNREHLEEKYPNVEIIRLPKAHRSMFV